MLEMDHSSEAELKEPLKRSSFIHFSTTSQPPRLTPRRNGILVTAEVAAGAEEVGVELGLELLNEVVDGLGVLELLAAAVEIGLEELKEDVDSFSELELEDEVLKVEALSVVEGFDGIELDEVKGFCVGTPSALEALLVVLKAAIECEVVGLDEPVG
jgi:hypothetical protein